MSVPKFLRSATRHLAKLPLLCLFGALLGCATPKPFAGAQSPLLFDKDQVQRADTLLFLVPGALASIEIFDPVKNWNEPGYAPIYYRFPGLDGLPMDHSLGIDNAATQIAALANRYPGKKVRILGYSTGGPIGILALDKIHAADVRAAAMSPAVTRAGGIGTAARAVGDVLGSALRVGSVDRETVWLDYYRTLLFGHAGLKDPALSDRIDQLVDAKKETIIIPGTALANAHSRDLRRWSLPKGAHSNPSHIRFFIGLSDPVFSTAQTRRFSRRLGGVLTYGYPGQGHLLFLTHPGVFDDVLGFFTAKGV